MGFTLSFIKKYGRYNFKREILYEVETLQEVLTIERNIVNLDFVNNRRTYNCMIGGKGGLPKGVTHNFNKISIYNINTRRVKYITIKEIDEYLKTDEYILGSGRKDHCSILNIKTNRLVYVPKQNLEIFIKTGDYIIKNTTADKIVVHNKITKILKYIDKKELNDYINNGYAKGNIKSGVNKNKIYVYNSEIKKHKRINIEELTVYLDNGWINGRHNIKCSIIFLYNDILKKEISLKSDDIINIENHMLNGFLKNKRKPNNLSNRIWINNYITNKRVLEIELLNYLSTGWVKGHKKHK